MKKSQVKKLFIPIDIPIYDQFTAIAVNLTDEELVKSLLDARLSEEKVKSIVEHCDLTGNRAVVGTHLGCSVARYPDMETLKDLSLIGHESLHVVFSTLEHVGLKYSYKSEEAYTYLLGFLLEHYRPYI